jgi:autotransporter-associated beta strand protein
VSLTSGSITGAGGTLTGSSYDAQNGSVSANLGGSASLTKSTANTVVLSGNNTYTGNTLVNAGVLQLSGTGSISNSPNVSVAAGATLDASARTDLTFTLNAGQTLNGFGTVTGLVAAASGSTVAPGSTSTIGTLTVSSNTTLAGLVLMKINHNTATNDNLTVATTLTEGGTLTVTNVAGTLAAADSFKLFTPGAFAGAFAVTNLPALGTGLVWDTSGLASSGIIKVVASVNTAPTNITTVVSGNTLTLSWPADHTGWRLQSQTNTITTGLGAGWSDVPGSTSVNSVNVTIDSGNGTVFYRMVYP